MLMSRRVEVEAWVVTSWSLLKSTIGASDDAMETGASAAGAMESDEKSA